MKSVHSEFHRFLQRSFRAVPAQAAHFYVGTRHAPITIGHAAAQRTVTTSCVNGGRRFTGRHTPQRARRNRRLTIILNDAGRPPHRNTVTAIRAQQRRSRHPRPPTLRRVTPRNASATPAPLCFIIDTDAASGIFSRSSFTAPASIPRIRRQPRRFAPRCRGACPISSSSISRLNPPKRSKCVVALGKKGFGGQCNS